MTAVYFESPHRLCECLSDLEALMPGALISVCRELTKIHEEYRQGSASLLLSHYREHPPRGEITLVIDPRGSFTRNALRKGSLRENAHSAELGVTFLEQLLQGNFPQGLNRGGDGTG